MLCEYYKGRITFEEAMHYDLGFIGFLWYNAMEEIRLRDEQRAREEQQRKREELYNKNQPRLNYRR